MSQEPIKRISRSQSRGKGDRSLNSECRMSRMVLARWLGMILRELFKTKI